LLRVLVEILVLLFYNIMTKRISVKVKAYQSDGLSRHCGKCNYNPCSLDMRRLCTNRFVEGYIKGYARAKKDIKESK
jgi:hypothetical protein